MNKRLRRDSILLVAWLHSTLRGPCKPFPPSNQLCFGARSWKGTDLLSEVKFSNLVCFLSFGEVKYHFRNLSLFFIKRKSRRWLRVLYKTAWALGRLGYLACCFVFDESILCLSVVIMRFGLWFLTIVLLSLLECEITNWSVLFHRFSHDVVFPLYWFLLQVRWVYLYRNSFVFLIFGDLLPGSRSPLGPVK